MNDDFENQFKNSTKIHKTFSGEILTEEYAEVIIGLEPNFGRLLILPEIEVAEMNLSKLNANGINVQYNEDISNHSIQDLYEISPIFELLVYLGLIKIDLKHCSDKPIVTAKYLMKLFADCCLVTKRGADLGIQKNFDETSIKIAVAHRELIQIIEVDYESDEQATVRFNWRWEPNRIWNALDPDSAEFKALPQHLGNQLVVHKYTTLLKPCLKLTNKGVADFIFTEDVWRLYDTTLDENSGIF